MNPLFETDRLSVRPFIPDEAAALYQNHLEDEVKKWIPNESYEDEEEALDAIGFFAACVRSGKLPYVLAVMLKETGELVGDTGVNEVDNCPGQAEIGYTICKKHSGKGLATELVPAMMDFVRARFPIHALQGRVMKGNAASLRVLEKTGFTFLREEQNAPDDPYGTGMLVYQKNL